VAATASTQANGRLEWGTCLSFRTFPALLGVGSDGGLVAAADTAGPSTAVAAATKRLGLGNAIALSSIAYMLAGILLLLAMRASHE
jgi:hypothetical protein